MFGVWRPFQKQTWFFSDFFFFFIVSRARTMLYIGARDRISPTNSLRHDVWQNSCSFLFWPSLFHWGKLLVTFFALLLTWKCHPGLMELPLLQHHANLHPGSQSLLLLLLLHCLLCVLRGACNSPFLFLSELKDADWPFNVWKAKQHRMLYVLYLCWEGSVKFPDLKSQVLYIQKSLCTEASSKGFQLHMQVCKLISACFIITFRVREPLANRSCQKCWHRSRNVSLGAKLGGC